MNSTIKALCGALILIISSSNCQADRALKDIEGNNIPFSSLKGKWVLINYWADWCKTCIDEIPQLNRFYQKHQKDPIVLYAVNYDDLPRYKQKRLSEELHIQYPSLASNPASDFGLEDIIGVPVTFIINPQGKLISTLYGGQNITTLERALKGNK